jgi:hypothetical protein
MDLRLSIYECCPVAQLVRGDQNSRRNRFSYQTLFEDGHIYKEIDFEQRTKISFTEK